MPRKKIQTATVATSPQNICNPVAKYAPKFNKAHIFVAKTAYRRKAKHGGIEPFTMLSSVSMVKGSTSRATRTH